MMYSLLVREWYEKKQMSFWEYVWDCSTVKENTINSVDNRSYIKLFDFVTIINSHKHFSKFAYSLAYSPQVPF